MTTTVNALTPDPAGSTTRTDGTTRPEEDLIRAEIPGTVLEVTVTVGDRVPTGGVVALLESMKMEIPVIAESAGTVTRIAVAEGWTVRTGDIVAASLPDGAPTEEHSAHDPA
ncbi:biotin/lipoyl-binding carrier protein [Pseudonocardia spinosispora]|uniref:biotin/lipoyl-binding carrier protein n=1 Tax=Pseudonocardia spinosispora TaxID=103441 RepID=UPI00041C143A|nr:biotin/lipoyl-binding carrier protein [Pseudonocardia spinosispora]